MIRCVIFDLDGTIYDYNSAHAEGYHNLQQYAVSHFNITSEKFDWLYDDVMTEIENELGRDCVAIHDRFLRFQRILEHIEESLSHVWPMYSAYWDTFLDSVTASPGIYEVLEWLKENGYKTGIGTNMTVDYQLRKLERLGLIDAFNFIVTSEETQKEKPSKELFDRCVLKAGCKAEECLFIGDNYSFDVEGARNAGMKALWFTNTNTSEAHISDFRELIEIICKQEAFQ